MVWPIHVVAVNGLVVQGLARQVFLLDVQKRIIFLVLIVLAVAVSPVLTAWAVACASLIAAAVNMSALARYADYPLGLQIRDVTPLFLACSPWAAIAWFVSTRWSGPPLVVAAALFAGIGVMTVVTAVSLRIPVVREMTQRIKAAFRA
jgi:hypothetical protein